MPRFDKNTRCLQEWPCLLSCARLHCESLSSKANEHARDRAPLAPLARDRAPSAVPRGPSLEHATLNQQKSTKKRSQVVLCHVGRFTPSWTYTWI
uniref:Secreted protein n=1 Tax=Steinernema glaseri TaxID=37863 RepID=A0A1I7ZPK2_9BILA